MKLYISGRISGRPTKLAQAEFGEAEAKIRKFGLIPVNPMNNGLPADTEWEDQMGQDIAMLLRCDAIYMLPGWQQSEGATLEYLTTTDADIPGRDIRGPCRNRRSHKTIVP